MSSEIIILLRKVMSMKKETSGVFLNLHMLRKEQKGSQAKACIVATACNCCKSCKGK